jgi:hypothetical protein
VTWGEIVRATLDQVVLTVIACGIPATRDSGDFQPPGALVQLPTIGPLATLASIRLVVPIMLVTTEPGQAGADWLIDQAGALLAEYDGAVSEPTTWVSPLNPAGLPATLISVQMNSQEGV